MTALLDIDERKHPVDQRIVVELSKVFRNWFEVMVEVVHRDRALLDNHMVDKMFAELSRQYMTKAGTDPVSVAGQCVEFLKAGEGDTIGGQIT